MRKNKPMPLLLIEDSVAECVKFKNCENNRTDIVFVGMTGSSIEGLRYVKTHMPEGVILDLELHRGKRFRLAVLGRPQANRHSAAAYYRCNNKQLFLCCV